MAKTNKSEAAANPQRPYLKSVHLRNVPPLRDVKASFKPGINVIIGKNGSGKTNFMKLVSQLVELHDVKYRGVGCELVLGGTDPEIKVSFEVAASRNDKKHFSSRLPANSAPLTITVTAEGEENKDSTVFGAAAFELVNYFEYQTVAVWHGIPVQRLSIVDEGLDVSFSQAGPIELLNLSQEWPENGASTLVQAFIDAIASCAPLQDYSFTATSLEPVRTLITLAVMALVNRLNEYLPIYSPIQNVRLSEQFQVYRNTTQEEIIVKGLALEYLVAGDWLPFGALSDGTKRIFFVIGELVTPPYVFINKERTKFDLYDFEKIILLEEPELGIHPKQLQLLLQLIREVSKEHQVILTTHSPQTLDMLTAQELDRITICDFVPGKGTQMRKLSAARKAKAKAYLRDTGFLSEFWRFSNLEDPD